MDELCTYTSDDTCCCDTYSLVLGQSSHTVLVGPLPLVGGVLGQSDINLGLELIAKVTVL